MKTQTEIDTEWDNVPCPEKEAWCDKAIEYLLRNTWLPMTDDVWATDKYADIIDRKAKEMWEASLS